ncbi:MAG: hypothetical protein ABFS86_05865 [Planctomycetota bacterium]
MRIMLIGMALVFVGLFSVEAAEKSRPEVKAGFKQIQKILKKDDPDLVDVVIPEKLVQDRRDWKSDDVRAWREGLTRLLSGARIVEARESGDDGVIRFKGRRRTEMEIYLRYTGRRWVVGSAEAFMVSGGLLKKARGKGAARATLEMRTSNESMGKSAYSFEYVTAEIGKCKNRFEVWFCRCGRLHANGDSRIAEVGSKKLDKVKGLPVGSEWKSEVKPEKGAAWVVRCRDSVRADFFVKVRVVAMKKGALELEWDLLAAGRGSPMTIHDRVPLDPADRSGANGIPGICGLPGRAGGDGAAGGAGGGGGRSSTGK